MIRSKRCLLVSFWLAALSLAVAGAGFSAPLPKATQEMLKKLKLDPTILSDIDKELQVPKAWMDGAQKERKLRIFSTFDPPQTEVLFGPFKERYPFIAIEYNRASHEDRAIRTLVAYKNKKSVTDILTGLGGSFFMYREIGAMEDLRNIPTAKNNPPGTSDPEGFWVGMHMRYWCMPTTPNRAGKRTCPGSGRIFSPIPNGATAISRWETAPSSGRCSCGKPKARSGRESSLPSSSTRSGRSSAAKE